MHSNRVNLAAAAFLVILGIVSTGIVASAYTSNPQNKSPESPISLLVPASIGSGPLGTTTIAGSYSAPLGPSQPHYFLQEGKASTGTLPSFSSNDVTYHGGPTMHISISYTIFWLPAAKTLDKHRVTTRPTCHSSTVFSTTQAAHPTTIS